MLLEQSTQESPFVSSTMNRLIWLDLEMTGLNIGYDRIIEIATVITDRSLTIVAEGPVLAIKQSNELLHSMDEWNTKQHGKSGLIDRVKVSDITESEAEIRTLRFLSQHVLANQSPMCGNSICTDRRYLFKYMPTLEKFFHYRNIDVSTIKELVKYWYGNDLVKGFKRDTKHLALADIKESINELKFYRQRVFVDKKK